MKVSRDLSILLVFMGVAFVMGYGYSESSELFDPEACAMIAAASSSGGMVLGYIFLAFEKRDSLAKLVRVKKRRSVFDPQIVGEHCTKCDQRVIFISEAFFCADCGKPYHRRCGNSPRCYECDAHVVYANLAIDPQWDVDPPQKWLFDEKKRDWVDQKSDGFEAPLSSFDYRY